MRVVVIKNEWKDEVQFLLKGMHHALKKGLVVSELTKHYKDQTKDH